VDASLGPAVLSQILSYREEEGERSGTTRRGGRGESTGFREVCSTSPASPRNGSPVDAPSIPCREEFPMLRKLMFAGVALVAVVAAGLTLSTSPASAVSLEKVAVVKA
jgi:hypothetical protein